MTIHENKNRENFVKPTFACFREIYDVYSMFSAICTPGLMSVDRLCFTVSKINRNKGLLRFSTTNLSGSMVYTLGLA